MLLNILTWYLIGCVCAALLLIVYDVMYCSHFHLKNVTWWEFCFIPTSWFLAFLIIFLFILEIFNGFPHFGSDK
jgi:hypothetical protein